MDYHYSVISTPFEFANPQEGRRVLLQLLEDVRDVARPLEGLDLEGSGPYTLAFTCSGGRFGLPSAIAELARGLGPHLKAGCRIELTREEGGSEDEGAVHFIGPSEEAILRCRKDWARARAAEELQGVFPAAQVAAVLGKLDGGMPDVAAPTLGVILESGVVREVVCDQRVQVAVADLDVDAQSGSVQDNPGFAWLRQGGGEEAAIVGWYPVTIDPSRVAELVSVAERPAYVLIDASGRRVPGSWRQFKAEWMQGDLVPHLQRGSETAGRSELAHGELLQHADQMSEALRTALESLATKAEGTSSADAAQRIGEILAAAAAHDGIRPQTERGG